MANSLFKELGTFIGQKFASLKKVAFTNSYLDLSNRPTIPNVPNWALQANKPTYSANEVNAIDKSVEKDLMKKSRIFLTLPTSPEDGDIYIKL